MQKKERKSHRGWTNDDEIKFLDNKKLELLICISWKWLLEHIMLPRFSEWKIWHGLLVSTGIETMCQVLFMFLFCVFFFFSKPIVNVYPSYSGAVRVSGCFRRVKSALCIWHDHCADKFPGALWPWKCCVTYKLRADSPHSLPLRLWSEMYWNELLKRGTNGYLCLFPSLSVSPNVLQ